ncbi:uncharacterized protein LOC128194728 [Vigna angularis]|uniref:uncharacterized protein LOC128194728 n=1 Tax=Phaseolus angularis TaxID=3914 RepID=UPI0022B52CCE|nr:uncharacterized protein LOC128194728 [Vigna angularis]
MLDAYGFGCSFAIILSMKPSKFVTAHENITRGMMSEMESERYTSQRWRPTEDQTKMMTNIYNYGVTHPSRAQVVEIASRLRAFGEATEYNVHCWFNNHGNRVRRWQAEIDPTGTLFSQLPLYMYEYDWVIMKAPRLLDLFPIPIIIDDDRDEREIPPPRPPTFRTRAPSTELTLRTPPSNNFRF